MKILQNIVFLIFVLLFNSSFGQKDKTNNLPKTKIDVQKEIDENGNIIRYDSTYSYFNNSFGDSTSLNLDMDSIFQELNSRFGINNDPFFQFQDTTFNRFFSPNFFDSFDIDSSFFNEDIFQLLEDWKRRMHQNIPSPNKKNSKQSKNETTL